MTRVKAISQAPCAHCPFRKDVPIYLRQDRREEIAESIANGHFFPCHETTSHDEDGSAYWTGETVECAGAAKAVMLAGGTTQMMRISERMGWADLDKVAERGPEVWELSEWRRLAEGSTGDDPVWEIEEYVNTCHVVDAGCTAPAGTLGAGGAILDGLEPADFECEHCGEWTCESCSNGDGVCNMCVEDYGEDFE
jgi:hypothetical protein